ncbi:acetolactate synthase II large subunit [Roseovarius sp. 217]|nr:acetolactate synthase II large subunit [Roseovarius sp. 217]
MLDPFHVLRASWTKAGSKHNPFSAGLVPHTL